MYTPRRRAKHAKRSGAVHRLRLLMILFLVVIAGLGFGYIFAAYQTLPPVTHNMRPISSSQVFDIHGRLITTLYSEENRLPIDINQVPPNLQNAFISAEDNRFYSHIGIDPVGIARAFVANVLHRGISQGGSTITQQLAKNAFLSQKQTLKRKIQEAMLALELERKYSKKEILEMYMNEIYFGQGSYGIQTAANTYFGKSVSDLSLKQCALLAGLPKSPNYYSPFNNPKEANERANVVLDQMQKYGYISAADCAAAQAADLQLASKKRSSQDDEPTAFIDYVTRQVAEKYGDAALYKQGLKIYTTLDLDKQKAAQRALRNLPTNYTDKNGLLQPQVALVSLDPHTGYIVAMIGGRNHDSFNRATMAVRQPGSAFKPFVYAAALQKGLTPDTTFDDKEISYGSWTPRNAGRTYSGTMTIREALIRSVNTIAVQTANQVGPRRILALAEEMGITTLKDSDNNLAMALGGLTQGVTPLEMAGAYGTFANEGVHVAPVAILKILDQNNNVLEDNTQTPPEKKQVLSAKEAYEMTYMLEGVIQSGTGAAANIGIPAAGKTGTTDNNVDAWFVGYTPDLVTAVWIGDDSGSRSLGAVYGGTIPARIWHDYMAAAVDRDSAAFRTPPGVKKAAPPADTTANTDDQDADTSPTPTDDEAAQDNTAEAVLPKQQDKAKTVSARTGGRHKNTEQPSRPPRTARKTAAQVSP